MHRHLAPHVDGVLEATFDAVVRFDKDRRVVAFNDAARSLWGTRVRTGEDVRSLFVDGSWPEVPAGAGQERRLDLRGEGALRIPGRVRVVPVEGHPEVAGALVARDLRDVVQAERASIAHQALLDQVLRSARRLAIFASDDAGLLMMWGPGAQSLLGFSEREALGRPLEVLQASEELPTTEDVRDRIEMRHRDDRTVEVQLTSVRLHDEAGDAMGTLFLAQDARDVQDMEQLRHWIEVEELRQRALALDRENSAMARANRLKTHFLANMSHELRTPLNSVLGFAKLLRAERAGPLNRKQRHYLDRVLEGGEHLLRLISDILDLARIESGLLEFHFEDVDLNDLAQETVHVVSALAEPKRLELSFAPAASQPARMDPVRFKQILYNYLSNGVKFTPEGGNLELRIIDVDDEQVCVEVEDTGIGIPDERQGELFSEFTQLENPMSKEHAGTGLGLAITRRIVEALGGRVGLRSSPGEGSLFYAVLPRYPVVPEEEEE